MSRLPSASGIPPPTRLARQPSLDLRRRKHQTEQAVAPPPVPPLKSTKSTRAPSLSRASVSSYEEVESPSSLSRYSLSSMSSTQTALTSPRTSLTSPKPSSRRPPSTSRLQQQQSPPLPPSISPTPSTSLRVGERVAVDSMGIVGTLRFLGPTQFKEGIWAGIQLDIPGTGKNDGSVNGLRYFSCPPQTGLFVQASKVTSLNSDNESVRSSSPPQGGRAARHVGMTANQLTQRQARTVSLQAPNRAARRQQQSASIQSPTPTRRHVSQPIPGATDGIPSPAITPTSNSNSLQDEADDDLLLQEDDMLTETPEPVNMALSKSTNVEDEEDEHGMMAPDEAAMRIQQLQLRVGVLEAENKYFKHENARNKTAGEREGGDNESLSLENHNTIVQEIKDEHAAERKKWETEADDFRSTIKKLETEADDFRSTMKKLEGRVRELEAEQAELIKERDALQEQLSEARKEKSMMEHKVHELEEKVAVAEANAATSRAAAVQQQTTANFYSQDPDEMRQRQMQMEMEMEEVHEKMGSLMEAMRAKDMFLAQLSEQVEMHRNTVEEREREVRRVRADAERHARERDRLREEVNELEAKWMQHQDCASREEFDKVKRELNQAKDQLARETAVVEDYRKLVEDLKREVDELKRDGMESIELYESSVELHRVDMENVKASLMEERRKVAALEAEREDLRKAGLDAIEAYEATIEELKKERAASAEENERTRQEMQATIDKLKQEMEQLVNAREKSHEEEQATAATPKEPSPSSDDERIAKLQAELKESKRQMEQIVVKHDDEVRQLKEKHEKEDSARQWEITKLTRDIAELEGLIESKVFKEADLEEALENERKKSSRMQTELEDLRDQLKQLQKQQHESSLISSSSARASSRSTSRSSNGPMTDDAPFCELCETPGHDLISCKAVVLPNKKDDKPYCENCDEYGLHWTQECPNQNEIF